GEEEEEMKRWGLGWGAALGETRRGGGGGPPAAASTATMPPHRRVLRGAGLVELGPERGDLLFQVAHPTYCTLPPWRPSVPSTTSSPTTTKGWTAPARPPRPSAGRWPTRSSPTSSRSSASRGSPRAPGSSTSAAAWAP